ncbi:uncharacterized protein isoform X1 [Leptinotarsa decemlineata]|uniref:uncharacterized protein isoform X1 n=1 Tax=Leptinotarsa decemlineata TaxID=7539 RepID=UPI003D30A829
MSSPRKGRKKSVAASSAASSSSGNVTPSISSGTPTREPRKSFLGDFFRFTRSFARAVVASPSTSSGAEIPYVKSLLKNSKRLTENHLLRQGDEIVFLSDKEFMLIGSIFVVLKYGGRYDVAVFTNEERGINNIYAGLMVSSRIRYNKTVFKDVYETFYTTVKRVIQEKKLRVDHESISQVYVMEQEKALKLKNKIPEDKEILTIKDIHAEMVNASWSHKYPGSLQYIQSLIRMNGGYVLVPKGPEGTALAWGLKSVMGQIGIVETMPDYRREGYGSIIVKHLAREIAEEGNDVVVIFRVTNECIQRLVEKIGFRKVGSCYDIEVSDPASQPQSIPQKQPRLAASTSSLS